MSYKTQARRKFQGTWLVLHTHKKKKPKYKKYHIQTYAKLH